MRNTITLPYNYDPRTYQAEAINALLEITQDSKGEIAVKLLLDRFFWLWHRRSGKDLTFIQVLMLLAWYHRVGTYWYMFPFLTQAKQVVWDGMDDNGYKFIDYFPPDIVADTNETELQITLVNGSIIKLMGADKFSKSGVGPNPIGVGLSEFAVSAKMDLALQYVQPMLSANGGWLGIMTTPRGKNHAYKLWNSARQSDRWFTSVKTVDDTRRDSDFDKVNPHKPYLSPIVSEEKIEQDKQDGMTEERVQQEYYCSFNAPNAGAYFAAEIEALRKNGRITVCPHEPTLPVETWWDIGHDDATAIWYVQKLFREIRCIDFYENRLKPFAHYAQICRADHRSKYNYSRHIGPHDLKVKEWFANKTRYETAADLGIPFEIQDKTPNKNETIEMVRGLLPRCIFDAKKTEGGVNSLECYHAEYDEETKTLGTKPEHDSSSNAADSFQNGAGADSTGRGAGVHGTQRIHRQTTGSGSYNVLARDFERDRQERQTEWRRARTTVS